MRISIAPHQRWVRGQLQSRGSRECGRQAMRRRYSKGLHINFAALRADIYDVGDADDCSLIGR
ncbi:MAG TPA: hypothetical protein VIS99_14290, partial [Terrimicrobiaceae bacterium]